MHSWTPSRRTALGALAAGGGGAASPLAGFAQAYPARPIRIAVGCCACAVVDIVVRTLG